VNPANPGSGEPHGADASRTTDQRARPLRVALVVHQYPPRYFTGTESYAHAIARTLHAGAAGATSGPIEVEVFAFDPFLGEADDLAQETDEVVDGVPVHRIREWQGLHPDPLRGEYDDPLMASRFGAWLDERRPDVLHVFHLRLLGVGLLGEARRRGIPVAVNLMDFWFLCPRVTLQRRDGSLCEGPPAGGRQCLDCLDPDAAAQLGGGAPVAPDEKSRPDRFLLAAPFDPSGRAAALAERADLLRAELLRCERIVAPSRFLQRMFAQNGVPENRTTILRYGIDPEGLDDARATPASPGDPAAPLAIGYAGSLAPHKGVHVLLEAFARIAPRSAPSPHLHVHGRLEDFPDYAAQLRRLAEGAHAERVTFHGPFARAERARIYGALDVLVVPSLWYENTPFVVLEAQACGVPVVVSDLGGLTESVRDGVDGEAFPPGDVDALATRLTRLCDERERLARYRSALPRIARIDEAARHFAELWRDLDAEAQGAVELRGW
jgi:glycosyltransferase involved in cell wall biosynthesis